MLNIPFGLLKVLVDSSGFLAGLNPRDEHYREARAIWDYLSDRRFRLYTTNFLIAETHSLIIVRIGHQHARTFLQNIARTHITTIRIRASDEQQARDIVLRYTDKDFSLIDAISFVIMQRVGIPYAFTFDHHFSQYGLNVLSL